LLETAGHKKTPSCNQFGVLDVNSSGALALQILQFVWLAGPFFSIGQTAFHFSDYRPDFCQLCVEFKEHSLVFWQLIFREDGIHWAFGLTQGAIYTLVGMDNEKVGTFIKAINGAYFHTVGMLALDAVFSYNECHS
jgi:uncharacterized protein involved in type VI secretion and phage assembly